MHVGGCNEETLGGELCPQANIQSFRARPYALANTLIANQNAQVRRSALAIYIEPEVASHQGLVLAHPRKCAALRILVVAKWLPFFELVTRNGQGRSRPNLAPRIILYAKEQLTSTRLRSGSCAVVNQRLSLITVHASRQAQHLLFWPAKNLLFEYVQQKKVVLVAGACRRRQKRHANMSFHPAAK